MKTVSYSKYLCPLSIRGIKKAGDICMPGDGKNLLAFTETPFIAEIDRIVGPMTQADRDGFRILMIVFALLPTFIVRWILSLADQAAHLPAFLSPTFRLINIGVKGVIYTLYYTDLTATQEIKRELHWKTSCGPQPEIPRDPVDADVREAFRRARAGAVTLRKLSVEDRLNFIRPLKKIILEQREYLINEIQIATGKSRTDSLMSEIFSVLDHLEYLEKSATKFLGDRKYPSGLVLMGKKSRVWFEPLGTVLCISPWNYPFYQAIVPITSALVCGNSVVYKPSELTPMNGIIEALLKKAHIPEDWVRIVYGSGPVGVKLIDEQPEKIFFIGSTRTGKKILEQASKYLIPVELELGGKDPSIVFSDANLDRAVAGVLWGSLTNTGQSCTSVERVYIEEPAFEDFRDRIVKAANEITLGVDRDGNTDCGIMTSEAQIKIVAEHLADALAKGAHLLTGTSWDRESKQIPPLVLTHLNSDMKIVREETFGPIIPLIPFQTEDEAVALANDSEYGLSASVWSGDIDRAERVARRLVTGNVSINNVMLTEGNHALPFGGVKSSGMGRFKGEFGFYTFSNIKSVVIDGNSKKIEANWYPFTLKKYSIFVEMMNGLFGKGIGSLFRFGKNGIALEGHSQKKRNQS